MGTYKTKRSRDMRMRMDILKDSDEFAKETFIKLRLDDSCWNRLLRYLRLKKPQRL
jgi:hypothetical protein